MCRLRTPPAIKVQPLLRITYGEGPLLLPQELPQRGIADSQAHAVGKEFSAIDLIFVAFLPHIEGSLLLTIRKKIVALKAEAQRCDALRGERSQTPETVEQVTVEVDGDRGSKVGELRPALSSDFRHS